MLNYLLRRLLQAIPLLLFISICLFTLLHLIPGGPEQVAFSPNMSEQARHDMAVAYGLDKPLPEQYIRWLWSLLQGNFGYRYSDGQPVIQAIGDRLPATLELLGSGFLVALLLAVPLGIIAALKQYSIVDYLLTIVAYIGIAMPIFWLGELLIIFFAIQHNWFPTGGIHTDGQPVTALDSIHHVILPVVVLAFAFIASWSRYLRAGMLDVLHQDYLRTARAKGLRPTRIVLKHALRNAAASLVTVVALDVGSILGGAVITETLFNWPGLGSLFFDSLNGRDYPLLMAMMILSAVVVILCNVLADILYALLDPRIRYS